jgi:hypothetical protein
VVTCRLCSDVAILLNYHIIAGHDLRNCVIHISGRIATLSLLGEEVITFGFRDKRTGDFAEGSRVKAFTAFEHKAEMKLDQLDPATFLLDLDLPGRVQEIKFVL